ncbi:DNA polymerase beta superfamily protein [Streptacidiphilus sp. P02-A3a]|uniref:nucleotidyltransferase domain-containing protein n=1 Tax=Streptacidiphilus sp. P02-A3a TaxID=2704468 RepID=UPI0015F9C065|nr:nucleotidyltransferase domain-containing protein [Streptacidiphilus sp. P02-A3a]QMU71996.1 nucleotidyltransferase [Streptacidiphilus sp. P02-A3a]
MNVLLSGVVGSTAYGLAHAGSDLDQLGVYAAPTVDLLGIHRPRSESVVTTHPDRTLHEAAKWCRLALTSNPTASELLWLPSELYQVVTPLGAELIELRPGFAGAGCVRSAYLGYCSQQLRKIKARGDRARAAGDPDGADRLRSAKAARHLVRLTLQGTGLHRTGELLIRLPDPERVRELGERIAERPEVGDQLLREAEEAFDRPGVLPAEPDTAAAEAWLRRVRAAFYPDRAAPGPAGPGVRPVPDWARLEA